MISRGGSPITKRKGSITYYRKAGNGTRSPYISKTTANSPKPAKNRTFIDNTRQQKLFSKKGSTRKENMNVIGAVHRGPQNGLIPSNKPHKMHLQGLGHLSKAIHHQDPPIKVRDTTPKNAIKQNQNPKILPKTTLLSSNKFKQLAKTNQAKVGHLNNSLRMNNSHKTNNSQRLNHSERLINSQKMNNSSAVKATLQKRFQKKILRPTPSKNSREAMQRSRKFMGNGVNPKSDNTVNTQKDKKEFMRMSKKKIIGNLKRPLPTSRLLTVEAGKSANSIDQISQNLVNKSGSNLNDSFKNSNIYSNPKGNRHSGRNFGNARADPIKSIYHKNYRNPANRRDLHRLNNGNKNVKNIRPSKKKNHKFGNMVPIGVQSSRFVPVQKSPLSSRVVSAVGTQATNIYSQSNRNIGSKNLRPLTNRNHIRPKKDSEPSQNQQITSIANNIINSQANNQINSKINHQISSQNAPNLSASNNAIRNSLNKHQAKKETLKGKGQLAYTQPTIRAKQSSKNSLKHNRNFRKDRFRSPTPLGNTSQMRSGQRKMITSLTRNMQQKNHFRGAKSQNRQGDLYGLDSQRAPVKVNLGEVTYSNSNAV